MEMYSSPARNDYVVVSPVEPGMLNTSPLGLRLQLGQFVLYTVGT